MTLFDLAIHDLFTCYCCALDNGEVETVVACFTDDATLKSPVIDLQGHAAIRAFAGRFAAQRAAQSCDAGCPVEPSCPAAERPCPLSGDSGSVGIESNAKLILAWHL